MIWWAKSSNKAKKQIYASRFTWVLIQKNTFCIICIHFCGYPSAQRETSAASYEICFDGRYFKKHFRNDSSFLKQLIWAELKLKADCCRLNTTLGSFITADKNTVLKNPSQHHQFLITWEFLAESVWNSYRKCLKSATISCCCYLHKHIINK